MNSTMSPAVTAVGGGSSPQEQMLDKFEKETQEFIFRFLPALFDDLQRSDIGKLDETQLDAINAYFHNIITLAALRYPYKYPFVFGSTTHRRIRRIHKYFQMYNVICQQDGGTLQRKEKIFENMQDALARLSGNYQVINGLGLSKRKQEFAVSVLDGINDVVLGVAKIGLKSVDKYVERYLDQNKSYVD